MPHALDNIAWFCLTGPHAAMASGKGGARRYAKGYPPLAGFSNLEAPDFDALAPLCSSGEVIYSEAWAGGNPLGWQVVAERTIVTMIWDGPAPAEDRAPDEILPLTPEHAGSAVRLAAAADFPVFGQRAIEAGEFFGIFRADRLIAMAGERLFAMGYREISAVCTDPEFEGRGFARRLVNVLVARELRRGEVPFLHVVDENTRAHGLYLRMGFRNQKESAIRVLVRE